MFIDDWLRRQIAFTDDQAPTPAWSTAQMVRHLLADHRRNPPRLTLYPDHCEGCGYAGDCDDPVTEHINDCPVLRALAMLYADQPDHNPLWHPQRKQHVNWEPSTARRPCANPLCSYLLAGGALYCCGPCATAHERRYEIHESGPLGHSPGCARREATKIVATRPVAP